MQSFSGKIIKTNPCKNNTYIYEISDKSNITNRFTFFANNAKYGLDTTRYVTVQFQQIYNEKYGQSNIIKKVTYGELINDIKHIKDFLNNGMKLSKHITNKIVDKYGDKTLNIIFNETSQLEKLLGRSSGKILAKINDYKSSTINAEFYKMLSELGVPSKYFNDIENKMGTDIAVIKDNIYDLYIRCKVPFKLCDATAIKLEYSLNNDTRINAFIKFLFKSFNHSGILYQQIDVLKEKCREYKIDTELFFPKLREITNNNVKYYTTDKIYEQEKQIENICNKLIEKKPVTQIIFNEDNYIADTLFDEIQRHAIKKALENGISIVTGPPGTGKSYVIKGIVEELQDAMVYLLAPTGAAVERLKEIKYDHNNISIRTIQSFIYAQKIKKQYYDDIDTGDDKPNENNPSLSDLDKQFDEFIFIIDEMSMVDLGLFYKFFYAVYQVIDNLKLVIIGDQNQLPSIQGGTVLKNLIENSCIATTFLDKIHRQEHINIYHNACLALDGKDLQPDNKSFFVINSDDRDDIEKQLKTVIDTHRVEFSDSSILIPNRENGVCVNHFNPILQNIYNPITADNVIDGSEFKLGDIPMHFRIGDKIIHGQNDKKKDIYNGSILFVESADTDDNDQLIMTCKYTDRSIRYHSKLDGHNQLIDGKLNLAFATTIHKAQGKGYKVVIVIIHSTSPKYNLLNRNLLYTAITRAKQKCIIICNQTGIQFCKNKMAPRITNLYNYPLLLKYKTIAMHITTHLHIISRLLIQHGINPTSFFLEFSYQYSIEIQKLFNILIHNKKLTHLLFFKLQQQSFSVNRCIIDI